MKKLMIGSMLALLSISTASADTYDWNDCSSKYNRPIAVTTTYGVVYLRPNTRDGWCTPGLDSSFFDGGDSSDSVETGRGDADNDCDYESPES